MAAGHGGRAEPPDWRGNPAPARPGGVMRAAPCRASFIPGAVSGAPGNRASSPTGAAPGGPQLAVRSSATGAVRSARSVVRPLGASSGVPASRGGRGRRSGRSGRRAVQSGRAVAARSGTGLPAAGPRGTVRARRSWSGRAPRGGLRRPGREAGAAGAWRSAATWLLPCRPGHLRRKSPGGARRARPTRVEVLLGQPALGVGDPEGLHRALTVGVRHEERAVCGLPVACSEPVPSRQALAQP